MLLRMPLRGKRRAQVIPRKYHTIQHDATQHYATHRNAWHCNRVMHEHRQGRDTDAPPLAEHGAFALAALLQEALRQVEGAGRLEQLLGVGGLQQLLRGGERRREEERRGERHSWRGVMQCKAEQSITVDTSRQGKAGEGYTLREARPHLGRCHELQLDAIVHLLP